MSPEIHTIGIYHKDCSDGTMAAAVLLKRFPDITLFPLSHAYTEEELEQIENLVTPHTTVYTVDCALGVEKLVPIAKEVVTIDHHIGNKEYLENLAKKNTNFTFIFDNNKSGSSLTWLHFFGEPTPKLIQLVEDFDLWKWKFGDKTKHVIHILYPSVNNPTKFLQYLSKNTEELVMEGKSISTFTDFLISSFVDNTEGINIKIGEYIVPAFNTPFFQSEIGNKVVEKLGKTVAIFKIQNDTVHVSFRGNDTLTPTALGLAHLLDGGGHRNAAGARVSLEEFCKMVII